MYNVFWNLDKLIKQERDRRRAETSKKVKIKEIEKEVADYCGLSTYNIRRIKGNNGDPSFKVALKLSEYFNVDINDLFVKVEGEYQYEIENVG